VYDASASRNLRNVAMSPLKSSARAGKKNTVATTATINRVKGLITPSDPDR
jgi:hypothetical protein